MLLLLLLLLLSSTSASASSSSSAVSSSLSLASSFVLSRRDPSSLLWPPLESASAVLALASADPAWRRNKQDAGYRMAKAGITIAVTRAASPNGTLSPSSMDDSTLAQSLSALQATCHWSGRVAGVDLLKEAERRMAEASQRSPALAGLALPLCNHGIKIPRKQVRRLRFPRSRRRRGGGICRSLCLEKASLNVLALTCIFKHKDEYTRDELQTANSVLHENVEFLRSSDRTRPAFIGRSLFETSLLLQASQSAPVEILPDLHRDAILSELLSLQSGEDGSFGGSVALTAIAVPAVSGFNALDIPGVERECRGYNTGNYSKEDDSVVRYRIEDLFFHAQTLVGDFAVSRREREMYSVLQLLKEFDARYPFVIRFGAEGTPFGSKITRLLDIEETRVVAWNVYKIASDKAKEEERILDLEEPTLAAGDTVLFRYERI